MIQNNLDAMEVIERNETEFLAAGTVITPEQRQTIDAAKQKCYEISESGFNAYDREETKIAKRMERIQASCHNPDERKRFILFGRKALRCTSLSSRLLFSNLNFTTVKPNK